ncbi:predicted protein [Chaetoceros tenuissimus]|uniref:Transmembrane protein n=1 Tax=Chaetoceros tenuissimus TaxID=426638 RepID=A0AAD3GY33_9STRA|nr:predicted protein [Chaetoceros tenuissimus]
MVTIAQVRNDAFFPSPSKAAAGRGDNKFLISRTPTSCNSFHIASIACIVLLLVSGLVISLVSHFPRLYSRRKSNNSKEKGEAHVQELEKTDRKEEEPNEEELKYTEPESDKFSLISDVSSSCSKTRLSIRYNKKKINRSSTFSSSSTRSCPLPTICEDEQVLVAFDDDINECPRENMAPIPPMVGNDEDSYQFYKYPTVNMLD